MKCKCGRPLTGRRKVQCEQCYMKSHPASSQCPFCFEWFFSHGGQAHAKAIKFHAVGTCRRGEVA